MQNKKLKIAIVSYNLSFVAGGPRLVFGLAKFLGELGQKVVIYAPDESGGYYGEISEGLDIRTVKPKSSSGEERSAPGFFSWILRKVRQEMNDIALAKAIAENMDPDFDVVNVHDFAYRVGYFYKKRNPKVRVIWNDNAPIFVYLKKGKIFHDIAGFFYGILRGITNKKYFRAMENVVVLDRFNEKWAEDHGFKNISIVRAGIDFKKFYAPVKDFGKKSSRRAVELLAVGALNVYRRYDNVVEAVRHLRELGYDAQVTIVANNIWREDKCRDELLALVKKYGLEKYVKFYFEGMPEERLIKTFRESDIFVQAVYSPPPSHHGWGLVNFEAMAAGLPVVVVGSATATEVLKDSENALFFEPLQPKQIAEKVKFLVDRPKEYARIAKAGQAYVKENQSWKKYAEEMLEAFRKTFP